MKIGDARLEIVLGCMFSGKTTELIRRTDRYRAIKRNVLLISHKIDVRCDENVQTHDGKMRDAIKTNKLMKMIERSEQQEADVIGVDESQFFGDLQEFVERCERDGKVLIISGLDGDYNRQPFGDILKCIPQCDEVVKLTALDKDGSPAIYSYRKESTLEKVDVGGDDKQEAVSRRRQFELKGEKRGEDGHKSEEVKRSGLEN